MALTTSQWIDWLRADAVERVVLVEAEAWSFTAGAVITHRWSDCGYITQPTDTPASTPYLDVLAAMPGMRASLPDSLTGKASVAFGDIDLDNTDGALGDLLAMAWDGRPLRVYLGQRDWPRADFVQVWGGVTADIAAPSTDRLTMKARDPLYKLTKRLSGSLFNGAYRPRVFGKVSNAKPILIHAGDRRYQVHDGEINAITAIRSDGVVLNPSNYSVATTTGTFTLATDYNNITCDVEGDAPYGLGYVAGIGSITARILTQRAGISSTEFNSTEFALAGYGNTAGVFLSGDQTADQAIAAVLTGAGWCIFPDRLGQLRITNIKSLAANAVLTITDDDLRESKNPIKMIRRILPVALARVGYKKNWTVQDSVSSSVSPADADELAQNYRVATASNTGLNHLMPQEPDVAVSAYFDSAPAQSEANLTAGFFSSVMHVFAYSCGPISLGLKLGDVVQVSTSHTYANGLGIVVGLRDAVMDGQSEIEVLV